MTTPDALQSAIERLTPEQCRVMLTALLLGLITMDEAKAELLKAARS